MASRVWWRITLKWSSCFWSLTLAVCKQSQNDDKIRDWSKWTKKSHRCLAKKQSCDKCERWFKKKKFIVSHAEKHCDVKASVVMFKSLCPATNLLANQFGLYWSPWPEKCTKCVITLWLGYLRLRLDRRLKDLIFQTVRSALYFDFIYLNFIQHLWFSSGFNDFATVLLLSILSQCHTTVCSSIVVVQCDGSAGCEFTLTLWHLSDVLIQSDLAFISYQFRDEGLSQGPAVAI